MDTHAQVGSLPEHLVEPLRYAAGRLEERLGADLVALVVYGSAARGEHVPKRSDVNLLVVLRQVDADHLRVVAAEVRRARRLRLAPILLSPDDLTRGRDAFAIELSEMQDHRVVIYGEDPFTGLAIDREQLRLQVERELRGKLVRLRQAYLHHARDPRAVARLMTASAGSFVTLFAAALRLRGEQPAPTRAELVPQLTAAFGLDGELLARLLTARAGQGRLAKREAHDLFSQYLAMVESVTAAVDRAGGA
jgi:predicted nucleotidyltransferase